jgi:outer membrane immunogenic protein
MLETERSGGPNRGTNMKKVISAAIGLLALAAAMPSATAADMAVKAPVYKAPPVYIDPWNWTGFYVGVNVGYSWGRSRTDATFFNNTTGAVLLASSNSFNLNGWLGGGQIGFNWQTGVFVGGLEADIQGTGQKGGLDLVCPAGICAAPFGIVALFPGGPVSESFSQKLRWFGTVRGRLGATFVPTVLAYVTGGLAYGEVQSDLLVSGTNAAVPVTAAFSSTSTRTGWTIGAGLEGRLGGNWTGKIEYLYMDLGTVTSGPFVTPIIALGGGFLATNFNSRITDNIFRVGVNYKFGPAPLVARY